MSAQSQALLIKGATIVARAGAAPGVSDIHVRDGRIAAIADPKANGATAIAPGTKVVDGANKLVIPGLINAHYHSHDVLSRGMFEDIPLEVWIALAILPPTRLTAREVRLRTLVGALECLLNGITTVQDMVGCGPGAEEHVTAMIQAYEGAGIRCVLGLQVGNRPAIDCLPGIRDTLPSSLHHLLSGQAPDVARILDFVAAPLRTLRSPQASDERPRLSRRVSPRLSWAIAPGSPQRCTFDLLSGLGSLAESFDLPIVTHVNESKLQVFLARELYSNYGGSVLDYLAAAGLLTDRLCMAHGIWFSDDEIARIAGTGAAVATNPTSNLKLKNGVAPLRRLRHAGVPIALGCDNTSAGDAQNMFEAMKLICHLNAGKGTAASTLSAQEAFAIATQGGARALGLDDEIGTIEVGKAADLALLDLSDPAYLPLNDAIRQIVFSENGRGVHTVIVDGEIVVENRRATRIDQADLLAEIAELAPRYAKDSRAHAARMAPALPYVGDVVRRWGDAPLDFDRWLPASDRLPSDGR
jgi:5-methylthioadenosine/S-adenosylhomocysteine deaminase